MKTRPPHNSKPHKDDGPKPRPVAARLAFPFTAIVGQEEMKLALLLNVIAPSVGGALVTGHRGTGKSTAVRALADLLPPIASVNDCPYNCEPSDERAMCDDCRGRLAAGEKLKAERKAVPVVELPLGATEDRVCGTVDIARALKEGVKSFEPGLLARANRGFLYIDEVNLLEDHLVDLLLDVAATGRNRVEREGVSAEHPSRFVLVGSGNPEEGELRPQLLDRFGLCAEVETVADIESRVAIVESREAFDRDPSAFIESLSEEQARLRKRILKAMQTFDGVRVSRPLLRSVVELCLRLGVDGHRGEITVTRAARALAAFEGRREVKVEDVRRVAPMSLRHRLRRDPLEHGGGSARIQNAVSELFGEAGSENTSDADSRRAENRRETTPATLQRAGGKHGGELFGGEERGDAKLQGRAGRAEVRDEKMNSQGESAKGEGLILPALEVGLKREASSTQGGVESPARFTKSSARRRAGGRKTVFAERGRYTGSSGLMVAGRGVALDATMRAAVASRTDRGGAASRPFNAAASRAFNVAAEDLRYKRLRGKSGALFIFLIDASGSMAANRIEQAKGALAQLLRRSYVNRDRVALVTFRGRGAELLLAPTGSAARACALLDALPVGGATPLAAGLVRALDVARAASNGSKPNINLVVFTDGRANVPLGYGGTASTTALKERIKDEIATLCAMLRKAGVGSLVVDTESRFTSGGEGNFLAESLGGRHVRLPQLISEGAVAEAMPADERLF